MQSSSDQLNQRKDFLRDHPDFGSFFAKHAPRPPHRIRKGTIIFSDGDPHERLYYIQEGFIKLFHLSGDGKDTIAYLYGPGYVVGLRALLSSDQCAKHNAEALTDVTVISMSHQEYFALVQKQPTLLIDLAYYFMDRLEYTEGTIEGFVTTDTTARVAYFFADFINRFCQLNSRRMLKIASPQHQVKNGPFELPLSFTHQRIGEFIGAFRETVSGAVKKLEADHILSIKRGVVTIYNVDKLFTFAGLKKTL